ncbi:hypothetical protein [Caldicellulosiruptor morganii]|uniref:Uncharacterized protein n=1 Tax=Caldicellulosiruptor morganii TaxID=1387555 RepID=A0ABY7BNZ2_9FIRM|nr:hypothetical protein [Caldicellulosiruptor morganii]WAM34153.1 hypothetical protein OTK00_000327 [Caldicellulosiruptor morganii]
MPKRNMSSQPSLFGDPGFSSWGMACYKKGQKNIVERHTHTTAMSTTLCLKEN